MTETFYELLGVPEDASTDEIETAYREEIKEVHPDVSDDVDAGDRTKRLNEAKQVLTDADERRRYDRMGHAAYTNDGVSTDANGSSGSGTTSTSGTGGPTDASGGRSSTTSGSMSETTAGSGPDGGGKRRRRSSGGRRESTGAASGRSSAAGGTTDATGPSRASMGPSWQSQGRAGSATAAGTAGGVDSPSARRQAAAGGAGGPVDWSWNRWERTRSWAVRQSTGVTDNFHPRELFSGEQSVVLFALTFFLYPFFIVTVLFPPFPLVARTAVAVCTVLMFAYLLSVPEVAVVVYGVWSLLVPALVFLIPGVSIFSLAGVVGLTATWIPFGLSVLTLSVLRP